MRMFWSGGEFGASTIEEILAGAAHLGIPAFQRGAVWSNDDMAVASLLNSLARGYFVGSLLLWVPSASGAAGAAPLVPGGALDALLVDGQQRVRALLGALAEQPAVGERTYWCMSPARSGIPGEFKRVRFEMDRAGRTCSRLPADRRFVPLALLTPVRRLMPNLEADAVPRADWTSATPEDILSCEDHLDRILRARISWRALSGDTWTLRRVIENYSRLNSSGQPLKKEELAFAELVEVAGDRVNEALAAVIRGRPGGDPERGLSAEEREEWVETLEVHDSNLERAQERDFGLSLFIRAVGIVRDYVEARETETRAAGLAPPENATAVKYVETARDGLLTLSRALISLHCDSCRRIPFQGGIERLVPVIFALVRHSELREREAEPLVRAAVLGRLLNPSSDPAASEVTMRALRCTSGAEALREMWSTDAPGRDAMLARVKAASTTNDRFVDMLYWLLRRQGAFDVMPPNGARGSAISRSLEDKQHVIPFRRAAKEASVRRTSSHNVNSLGNLTYISPGSNGLKGWSSSFMTFGSDLDNARRHFLDGDGPDSYGWTVERARGRDDESVSEDELGAFVGRRSEQIAIGFMDFWSEVRDAASAALGDLTDRPPEPRTWNLRDHLHRLGFRGASAEILCEILQKSTRPQSQTWRNGSRFRLCNRNETPSDPLAELRYDARWFPVDDFRWHERDVHLRIRRGQVAIRVSGAQEETVLPAGAPESDAVIERMYREATNSGTCRVWQGFLGDITCRVNEITGAAHKSINRHPLHSRAMYCEQTWWHRNGHNAILRLRPAADGKVLVETMLRFGNPVDPDERLAHHEEALATAIVEAGHARPRLDHRSEWRKFGNLDRILPASTLDSEVERCDLAREMATYIALMDRL